MESELVAYAVYIVVNPFSNQKGLDKPRPYLLLRARPSCTERSGYLMVPLSRQRRALEHVPVTITGEVSFVLLDRPMTIQRSWIRRYKGELDLQDRRAVQSVFRSLIEE